MNGGDGKECAHYRAFPKFQGETETRLRDVEGRMDDYHKEGKRRDGEITQLGTGIAEVRIEAARTISKVTRNVTGVLVLALTLYKLIDMLMSRYGP